MTKKKMLFHGMWAQILCLNLLLDIDPNIVICEPNWPFLDI